MLLPALETLRLIEVESASAGPDGAQLVKGLGVGALPAVTCFELHNVCTGDAGASALAAALDRGALPRLKGLALINAAIGDACLLWPSRRPCGGGPRSTSFTSLTTHSATRASPPSWRRCRQMRRRRRLKRWRSSSRSTSAGPRSPTLRVWDLTLEQKRCTKGGVGTARRGVRTLGVCPAEVVLERLTV